MPLISFPDVPPLPGVPPLARSGAQSIIGYYQSNMQKLATQQAFASHPNVVIHPAWSILDDSGFFALQPDSVIDFEYKGERKIPNYPVEQGSFANYNKVATPFDIRLTCSCNGHGEMKKADFLSQIQSMLDSLSLYTIVTPDANYSNVNLVHVDYRRNSKQGATLILAQLWFEEIRTGISKTAPTANPDNASQVSHGQTNPTTPTTLQTAAYNQATIQ